MSWQENFNASLEVYRTPLLLLTAATFTILLARLFVSSTAAFSIGLGFFVIGALSLLAAGVTAAYTIVRAE